MRHVLCIAYLFPPQGGGGVQRVAKFTKYLPQFGWQATVLTAYSPGSPRDPTLLDDVPPQTRVERVWGLVLPEFLPWRLRHWIERWLLVVDGQVGWLPFAARRGKALLQRHAIDALYSTSRPYTDHLVALRLKRFSNLPWVADFRDPWLRNISAAFATPLHRALCARLEREVVLTADRVLVVSEPMRRQFLATYPGLSPAHVLTLPNGFDPADFKDVAPASRDGRFTVVYTGSLYGRATARTFLTALRRLTDHDVVSRDALCVRFVGNTGAEAAQLVADWQLSDLVELYGYAPHAATISHQLAADVLLLIIGDQPGSEVVLTGKVFEYLAAGKPVLALIPPGSAADLLTEAQIGRIVPPDDVEATEATLSTLFREWRAGLLRVSPDPTVVARYDRRRQAQRLADTLDDLTHASSN